MPNNVEAGPVRRGKALIHKLLLTIMLAACAGLACAEDARDPLPWIDAARGKVVLLDFWASWCTPCRQSFPWMAQLQHRYGPEGLLIVAVNLDRERPPAERFLAQTPAGFRIEYDPEGELATQFDVTGMPMSFLIDRHGRIRGRHAGFREAQRAEREAQIRSLLQE